MSGPRTWARGACAEDGRARTARPLWRRIPELAAGGDSKPQLKSDRSIGSERKREGPGGRDRPRRSDSDSDPLALPVIGLPSDGCARTRAR